MKPCASWCADALMLVLRQTCNCHKPWGHQGWHQFLGTVGVRQRRSWWKAGEGTLAWPSKLSWWMLFALHFGLIWGSCSLVSSWSPTETTCGVGRGRAAPPACCWDECQSVRCRGGRNPLAPPPPILPQNYSPPPQRDPRHTTNLSISLAPSFPCPFPCPLGVEEELCSLGRHKGTEKMSLLSLCPQHTWATLSGHLWRNDEE